MPLIPPMSKISNLHSLQVDYLSILFAPQEPDDEIIKLVVLLCSTYALSIKFMHFQSYL